MPNKTTQEEKQTDLIKYRALVLAALDYYIESKEFKTDEDSVDYFKNMKIEAEKHFQKGRLTKLKQWFRDITEMQVEGKNLKFNRYLQDKTKYDIDIFQSFFNRIEKIIEKGKITTDNQFYDIKIMVDQLCQSEPVDNDKIEILNTLLRGYENKRSKDKKSETK
jgi:hypothetical protein